MKKIRNHCAGIDIGAKRVFTSVEGEQVVSHLTFTEDFYKLRDYLLEHQVETVAMEATGVYWIILYEILEEAGLDVWLVDGRQTKQVPGSNQQKPSKEGKQLICLPLKSFRSICGQLAHNPHTKEFLGEQNQISINCSIIEH